LLPVARGTNDTSEVRAGVEPTCVVVRTNVKVERQAARWAEPHPSDPTKREDFLEVTEV
jgi:hypothetical protein